MNKTITGDNSANGRGNIFTKKNPNKHKIEKTQMKKWLRNLTASGRFEKTLNKQRRRLKVVPYEGGDEKTETNAHVIERKGEMIKHLIRRWHLYSKLSKL